MYIFSGVNDLSRKVYVQRIPSKAWTPALKPAITKMLKSPGFEQVTRIVTDGEAALSTKNVKELQVDFPNLKVVRLFPPQKAYR